MLYGLIALILFSCLCVGIWKGFVILLFILGCITLSLGGSAVVFGAMFFMTESVPISTVAALIVLGFEIKFLKGMMKE